MRKIHFIYGLLIIPLIIGITSLQAGFLELRTNYFYNFETYFISDFDFDEGSNNPDIFSYTLSYTEATEGEGPIEIKIEFQMIANIPSLGLDNDRVFYIKTDPFEFLGEITLTSRDIDLNIDNIYYTGGPNIGEPVDLGGVEESEFISEDMFNNIQQVVMSSGKLPAGTYLFDFSILNVSDAVLKNQKQVIEISNPSTLDLIAPGGTMGEENEIYTLYPQFQWESEALMWNSDYCPHCGYAIRVSEYDPTRHSSLDEAINDQSNLPFPDDGGYYTIAGNLVHAPTNLYQAQNYFQYPSTDAAPLEQGKQYVWQITKIYPTTSGSQTQESDIYIFSIPTMGGGAEEEGETGGSNITQYMQIIEQLIGTEQFSNLFVGGPLDGYTPTGTILLNNTQQITMDQLTGLVNQAVTGQITIQNVTVQ